DKDTTRPTKLSPLGDEVSVRVEDLDATVDAVADIDPSARIERNGMRCIELALPLAVLAPGLEQSAVLGILHDAIVGSGAMAVGDVNVAVGRNCDIGGAAQIALVVARHSRLADRHQHLSVRAELDGGAALAVAGALVGDPDIALAVDGEAVREVDESGAQAGHELAGRIELYDPRHVRLGAVVGTAALEHPNALAVAIGLDRDCGSQFAAIRQLRPVLLH